jgi:hypothetical protein
MTAQRAMKAGANRRGLMLARRWRAQLAEQATPRRQALAGLALLALLAWPALHQYLQASMWRHMLLQYLLWMAAGALLAPAIPPRMRGAIARCNAHGLSGLVFTAVVLAVLMVPRVLDLALREPAIDLAKCAALVLAGSALRLSWPAATPVVQGFFLGNLLPMTFVVGQLYLESPLRLCNAYLLDDQARLGRWLSGLAVLLALAWLLRVGWRLARPDAPRETAAAQRA